MPNLTRLFPLACLFATLLLGGPALQSAPKDSTTNLTVIGPTTLTVSTTAYLEGPNVCGVIHVMNDTGQTMIITRIVDSLEARFPVLPPAHTRQGGLNPTWTKVADIPITLPGNVATGEVAAIDYCFPLCLAANFFGANSLRNTVVVDLRRVGGRRSTFTASSPGFPAPVHDCRACCFADDSCVYTLRSDCLVIGGTPLLFGSDCDTQCTQACCFVDAGEVACEDFTASDCSRVNGTAHGPGTRCGVVECPRACCFDNASCAEMPASACETAGGDPQTIHDSQGNHVGITCEHLETLGGCKQLCCGGPGMNFCNTLHPDVCISAGGFPQGTGVHCGMAGACDGACCLGSGCEVMHWSECEAQGGDWHNPGTDCGFGPFSPCTVISP